MHEPGAAALAPAADLVARFRADVAQLAGGAPERLGVAVSGGPDSLALLLLAHAAFPGRIAAATVDHGLRPESGGEAAGVGEICHHLGVPHTVLHGEPAKLAGGLQAAARALRYRLLGDWAAHESCSQVATAHHADDQAETILMRMGRGAGLPGLAGIRPCRPLTDGSEILLIRPLLDWRRQELAAIVAASGLEPVDDPSNRSPRFDRSRIRAWLAAAEAPPAPRLAAAAAHLEDCDEALAWAADAAWRLRATVGDEIAVDAEGLPRELRRRLARRAIEDVRRAAGLTGPWREDGLVRVLATLDAGGAATLGGVLCRGGAGWTFRPAPPRRA
ncbi:tRNA lysidine(34) synthetase TilS [Sphingosinicella sp.]|uniref:tRNA lysidine(34) synthetase TilS n=1 Tax=Sphingosinicella sp. TaxID=1917971 RepID=UPI004037AE3A